MALAKSGGRLLREGGRSLSHAARCEPSLDATDGPGGRGTRAHVQDDGGTDDALVQPADLVKRAFTATRPNQLWVADLTYVADAGAASSTWPSSSMSLPGGSSAGGVSSLRCVRDGSVPRRSRRSKSGELCAPDHRHSRVISLCITVTAAHSISRFATRTALPTPGLTRPWAVRLGDSYDCEHDRGAARQGLTPVTNDLVSLR